MIRIQQRSIGERHSFDRVPEGDKRQVEIQVALDVERKPPHRLSVRPGMGDSITRSVSVRECHHRRKERAVKDGTSPST
jgi:hypothetical protein